MTDKYRRGYLQELTKQAQQLTEELVNVQGCLSELELRTTLVHDMYRVGRGPARPGGLWVGWRAGGHASEKGTVVG